MLAMCFSFIVSAQDSSHVIHLNIAKPTGIRPAYCDCPDFELDKLALYAPVKITASKNEVEIRLFQAGAFEHGNNSSLTILKYNHGKWEAARYLKEDHGSIDLTFPDGIYKYQYHKTVIKYPNLDSFFQDLVSGNAFTVQDQSQIDPKLPRGPVIFEYKIGKRTNSYVFGYPYYFLKNNPKDEQANWLLNILQKFNALN